jgi:hypothetical protein
MLVNIKNIFITHAVSTRDGSTAAQEKPNVRANSPLKHEKPNVTYNLRNGYPKMR